VAPRPLEAPPASAGPLAKLDADPVNADALDQPGWREVGVRPKPVEPDKPYAEASDFHKGAPLKDGVGIGDTNPWMGGFKQTSNEFSFPSDPGRKPPSGI
jgi:hypothetical protein